jgi:anionic glutamate receptor
MSLLLFKGLKMQGLIIYTNSILAMVAILSVEVSSRKSQSTNYRQVEKKILDRILKPDIYDSQIRPLGTSLNQSDSDESTKVLVNLFVRSFEKIDDVKMEFSIQITFRQQWNDNRLAFGDMGGKIKYLTMTERSKVWMPDTFFRNEKEAKFHEIIQPNLYVRVFPDGDVLYSIRVTFTVEAFKPRNLTSYFPYRSP